MKYLFLSLFLLFSLNAFTQSLLLKGGMVHSGNGEGAQIQDILITGNTISRVGNNLAIKTL